MATQQVLTRLMLILTVYSAAVFAESRLDPVQQFKNTLYQDRTPPRQDEKQTNHNISSQCKDEISRLIRGDLKTLEHDAIMALDAFGKPAAGILQLNLAWLGHYDECMAIEGFNYCLVDMALNLTSLTKQSSLADLPVTEASISWGICPPANCSEQDIHVVLKDLLDALKILESINVSTDALSDAGVFCTKNPPIPYNAGFICTVILCCFIASLMLIGALYDEYLKLQDKKSLRQRLSVGISRPWRLLDETNEADDDDAPLLSDVGTELSINNEINLPKTPKKQSLTARLLLCFALNRNLAKLMDVKQGDTTIRAINGIRVISMFWVILGHTIFFGFSANITENSQTIAKWIQTHAGFQAVANAFFAVDTFFFLSGFLLAYLTFGRFQELRTVKTWALFYFHRYWRLTPLFAFTILIYMYLPQFFGDGPIWQRGTFRPFCPTYWWSSLLYIGNFWPTTFTGQCIGWTWYLANDMQFFIISPLLMVPLYYFPLFGWVALLATLVASFISTGVLVGVYDLNFNLLESLTAPVDHDYFSLVYEKPYCRIAPYLVGIGLGYIMHRTGKRRVIMSPMIALIGWLVAAAMAMSVVYGLYPSYQRPMPRVLAIIYASVSRFVWALALAWVAYACKYGYGGWINSFLSWGAWVPLGRVTFSAYMVHPMVIKVFYDNLATPWHFSVYLTAFHFAGFVTISYFIAIFLSLAIEYPFGNLEKLLLSTPPRAKEARGNNPPTMGNGVITVIRPPAEWSQS